MKGNERWRIVVEPGIYNSEPWVWRLEIGDGDIWIGTGSGVAFSRKRAESKARNHYARLLERDRAEAAAIATRVVIPLDVTP